MAMMWLNLIISLVHLKTVLMTSSQPKLLVVSYDAFRYDYFKRNCTPFMNHLKEEGTDVDYMKNIFVTKTFPNHHTIVTGFFAETHGVMDNSMLVEGNKIMNMSQEMYSFDKNILPIWTLNQLKGNGRHSGAMMWPGSEFKYNGTQPTHFGRFDEYISKSWKERADKVISWFLDEKDPINFAVLYIEEPDAHAHGLGTQHPKINELLRLLDNFTKYLQDKLEENNLEDVNVIHLSDHGMADVPFSNIINITSFINPVEDAKVLSKLSTAMIEPRQGKAQVVYEKLKKASKNSTLFQVYWKKDIPKKYHYGNNERLTPIFVVAKTGYAFQDLVDSFSYYEKTFNAIINNQSRFGVHGYDNEDPRMHPMFFARGPAFVSRCKLEPFDTVDLLPLFCHILEMDCPKTNGTLNSFEKCLQIPASTDTSSYIYLGVLAAVFIAGAIGLIGYLFMQRRRRRVEILYRRIWSEAKMEQLWNDQQDFENVWH